MAIGWAVTTCFKTKLRLTLLKTATSEFTQVTVTKGWGYECDTDGQSQTATLREMVPFILTQNHESIGTEVVSYSNRLSCQHFREAGLLSGQFVAIVPPTSNLHERVTSS